jgi:hypothetical protein
MTAIGHFTEPLLELRNIYEKTQIRTIGLTLCLTTSVLTGCGEPEIAAVLDD